MHHAVKLMKSNLQTTALEQNIYSNYNKVAISVVHLLKKFFCCLYKASMEPSSSSGTINPLLIIFDFFLF